MSKRTLEILFTEITNRSKIALIAAVFLLALAATATDAAILRNGRIVFTRGTDVWPSHIYVMNLDGSGLKRLSAPTNTPIDTDPVWSPDGSKIAFASGGFNDLADIFVMNADGTGRVQLTESGSYLTYEQSWGPAWSPDGSKIAFYGIRTGQSGLYVMNVDGTNVRLIDQDVGCCSRPSWAPDNIQLVFHCEGGYGICTINTLDGSKKNIAGASWYDWEVASPAWSPDGSTVAYARVPYEGYYGAPNIVNEIWLVDVKTLATRNLTNSSDLREASPTWLPDGSGLVFTACCEGTDENTKIYRINSDGSGRVRLTNPPNQSISDLSPDVQALPYINRISDFDGDGRTDLAIWRPNEGRWYLNNSIGYTQADWGLEGDRVVAGNYDGDDKTDFAVFRPSNNRWYRVHSLDGTIHETEWGLAGDFTVPADYDGDGKNDLAVWRPSDGRWYINTGTVLHVFEWGINGDKPIPRDYDDNGRAELGVFRNGQWYILDPFTGAMRFEDWGLPGDIPVPADYDGDGKIDTAIFRPSEGRWYIRFSKTGQADSVDWGLEGDTPLPADYDADGRADIAVFRSGDGLWYRMLSSGGISVLQWGLNGDIPATAVQTE
jgi:Tol biopolymer transport system component